MTAESRSPQPRAEFSGILVVAYERRPRGGLCQVRIISQGDLLSDVSLHSPEGTRANQPWNLCLAVVTLALSGTA